MLASQGVSPVPLTKFLIFEDLVSGYKNNTKSTCYDNSMNTYLLVLEITPMDVGNVYKALPLHCTLIHWFWLDLDPASLTARLESLLKDTPSISLKSGKEAVFTGKTKHGDIPVTVNTVELTADLKSLHFRICEMLDALGVRYGAPQYVKNGYSPHVTHQKGQKFLQGTTHQSTALYLIQADAPEYGNDRYICSKIELND